MILLTTKRLMDVVEYDTGFCFHNILIHGHNVIKITEINILKMIEINTSKYKVLLSNMCWWFKLETGDMEATLYLTIDFKQACYNAKALYSPEDGK